MAIKTCPLPQAHIHILLLLLLITLYSTHSISGPSDLDLDYVDPFDMGSYSHSTRTNSPKRKAQLHDHDHGPSGLDLGIDERIIKSTRAYPNHIEMDEEIIKYANPQQPKPQLTMSIPVEQNYSRTIKYFQRVIASIIHQLNLRGKTFGPRESITIDLQAEISYEDYLILNQFSLSSPEDPETTKYLSSIDAIISNLLHVVQPSDSMSTREYIKELLLFHLSNLWNFKAWLTVLSLSSIGLIIVILITKIIRARSDLRSFLLYFLLLFFVLSCCWSYAERYETVKAQNVARLRQYSGLPRDCNWNDLSSWESFKYFWRVKIARYPDQCEEYYKEELTDTFYLASPVEAISDTFSKLIFHPMEYIGIKLGKFFAGLVQAVPFWLQPFLLVLVFVFLFLACCRYKISSPFISIEPSYAPRLQHQPCGAVLEKPSREIVPLVHRDAWTSTDDLEDYIRSQNQGHDQEETQRPQPTMTSYFKYILSIVGTTQIFIVNLLRVLLIEIPNAPPTENDDNDDDEFWNVRPILPQPQPAEPLNLPPTPSTSKTNVFKNSFNSPKSDSKESLPEGFDELLDLDMDTEGEDETGVESVYPTTVKNSSCRSSHSQSQKSCKLDSSKDEAGEKEESDIVHVEIDSTYSSFSDFNLSSSSKPT